MSATASFLENMEPRVLMSAVAFDDIPATVWGGGVELAADGHGNMVVAAIQNQDIAAHVRLADGAELVVPNIDNSSYRIDRASYDLSRIGVAIASENGVSGHFVLTWAYSWGYRGISARVYSFDLSNAEPVRAVTNTFSVIHNQSGATVFSPRVGMADNGNFVVGWTASKDAFQTSHNAFAQRYNSAGAAVGKRLNVANSTGNHVALAVAPAGAFAMAWSSQNKGTHYITGQQFSADGKAGQQLAIAQSSTQIVATPDVALDAGGNMAVVWQAGDPNQQSQVWGRYFPAGSAAGAPTRLNPGSASTHQLATPRVAMLRDGTIAASWLEYSDQTSRAYAQVFTSNWSPIGELISKSGTSGVMLAAFSEDAFVFGWAHNDTPNRAWVFSRELISVGSHSPVAVDDPQELEDGVYA